MLEASVDGSGVNQTFHSQLPNESQSLKVSSVDDFREKRMKHQNSVDVVLNDLNAQVKYRTCNIPGKIK